MLIHRIDMISVDAEVAYLLVEAGEAFRYGLLTGMAIEVFQKIEL